MCDLEHYSLEFRNSEEREAKRRYILEYGRKHNTLIYKIYRVLYNIRHGKLEPSFINTYRKEEVTHWDLTGRNCDTEEDHQRNEEMDEDDPPNDDDRQKPERDVINEAYVKIQNEKRAEIHDPPLDIEEYMWYRKERKPIDEDDERDHIPENELPDEVTIFIPSNFDPKFLNSDQF